MSIRDMSSRQKGMTGILIAGALGLGGYLLMKRSGISLLGGSSGGSPGASSVGSSSQSGGGTAAGSSGGGTSGSPPPTGSGSGSGGSTGGSSSQDKPEPSKLPQYYLLHCPQLSLGSRGGPKGAVSYVQAALAYLRFNPESNFDGVYGPVTKNAVEKFQKHMHITVDGIVGPQTYSALHKACQNVGGYFICK